MALTVTAADLDTMLGLGGTIDTDRATFLIGLATDLCTAIVNPVPDNARAVVLSMASRAYSNPQGVISQTVGPESVAYASGVQGLYLSRDNERMLRLLAGSGGAFTVNPTPVDAGCGLPTWDRNVWLEPSEFVRENGVPFYQGEDSEDVGLP